MTLIKAYRRAVEDCIPTLRTLYRTANTSAKRGKVDLYLDEWLLESKRMVFPWGKLNMPRCEYCGGPFEVFDHRNPSKMGGKDEAENLAFCCIQCNLQKGAMQYENWQRNLQELEDYDGMSLEEFTVEAKIKMKAEMEAKMQELLSESLSDR